MNTVADFLVHELGVFGLVACNFRILLPSSN